MGIFGEDPFFLSPAAVVLHIATFLLLFWLLKILLFDPILRVINDRRNEIKKGKAYIEQRRSELSERIQEFEELMEEKREQARQEMQAIVSEGEERRNEIVSEAHDDALKILDNARSEVQEETEKARNELQEHTANIAVRMAEQISEVPADREKLESILRDVS